MRRILYQNPGLATFNLGDQIISESVKAELSELFKNDFIVEVSSRLPLNHYFGKRFISFDYKLVLGSNILNPNKTYGYRKQWAISSLTTKMWGPAILVGVGWSTYATTVSAGQKRLWRAVLHKSLLHSVRDNYTNEQLIKLGYSNTVNTGCPTMWSLTPAHCEGIPAEKSSDVVFTLTDYRPDPDADRKLIRQLLSLYKKVYFWPQGISDSTYIENLLSTAELDRIIIVPPSLSEYDRLLTENRDIEYVGTRLHGGTRALQKKRRALIVSVDNRASEIHRDTLLPIIERTQIDLLEEVLHSRIDYDLNINFDQIHIWKAQFHE